MIVVQVADPLLRQAVCRAAHPEEDVVFEADLVGDAIERGFPRLIVRDSVTGSSALRLPAPLVEIDELSLGRWDAERRSMELPPMRVDHLTRRIASLMPRASGERSWVDTALADLSRAAGTQLPRPLRCFARRVLEFPSRYTSLYPLADACGTSRGALKARFRRRGLASPYTYLRWFRIIAVAHVLSDRSVTVASAARRLGFTSDGNLCRMMDAVAGVTPTEARTAKGWNRLLIRFAWTHLSASSLEAWASFDRWFDRRVA